MSLSNYWMCPKCGTEGEDKGTTQARLVWKEHDAASPQCHTGEIVILYYRRRAVSPMFAEVTA